MCLYLYACICVRYILVCLFCSKRIYSFRCRYVQRVFSRSVFLCLRLPHVAICHQNNTMIVFVILFVGVCVCVFVWAWKRCTYFYFKTRYLCQYMDGIYCFVYTDRIVYDVRCAMMGSFFFFVPSSVSLIFIFSLLLISRQFMRMLLYLEIMMLSLWTFLFSSLDTA